MVASSLAALAQAATRAARAPAARKSAIELTGAAANRIRELLDARHKVRGRLAARAGSFRGQGRFRQRLTPRHGPMRRRSSSS